MTARGDGIPELERRLGHSFSQPWLLRQAITHRSFAVEQLQRTPDNEVIEFLGDAVLGLVVSHLLYIRHGARSREGDLTRMRAFLVNETQLAARSEELGLGERLCLGKGEARSGGRFKASILADAFEAVMGAIYLDGGLEAATAFVERCFGDLLERVAEVGLDRDYKSLLQEVTQGRYHAVPAYEVEESSGPDHAKTFIVAIHFRGQVMARGRGHSKKEAEQDAARQALAVMDE